jgi:hypothetical protein
MAVRSFDLSEPQSPTLRALEASPVRRRDLRRLKQRYAMIGVIGMAAPFVAALIVLGAAH